MATNAVSTPPPAAAGTCLVAGVQFAEELAGLFEGDEAVPGAVTEGRGMWEGRDGTGRDGMGKGSGQEGEMDWNRI